jgi:hypothetical protein
MTAHDLEASTYWAVIDRPYRETIRTSRLD